MKREKIVIFMLNAREKVERNKKKKQNNQQQHKKSTRKAYLFLLASGACAFQLYFYVLRTKNFIY